MTTLKGSASSHPHTVRSGCAGFYGAAGTSDGLERLLKEMMAPRLFPVSLSQLPAKVTFRHLAEHDRITFHSSPPTEVLARFSKAHPKWASRSFG